MNCHLNCVLGLGGIPRYLPRLICFWWVVVLALFILNVFFLFCSFTFCCSLLPLFVMRCVEFFALVRGKAWFSVSRGPLGSYCGQYMIARGRAGVILVSVAIMFFAGGSM